MRFAIAVLPLPEVPTTTTRIGFCSLVSRFRSSHHFAAHTFANFGIKGTLAIYDSSAVFGFEVPTQTRGYNDRNFKSTALAARPRLRILGQPVGKMNPGQLSAHVRVIAWRHRLGVIETARRDVDRVGTPVALKRQLGAAMATEAADCVHARPKARWSAGRQSKLGRPDAQPSDKRRPSRAPTDGTVAIRFIERNAGHLVTDPAAKASALQHLGVLSPGTVGLSAATAATLRHSAWRAAASNASPANRISPASRFDLNTARQSTGSWMSSRATCQARCAANTPSPSANTTPPPALHPARPISTTASA